MKKLFLFLMLIPVIGISQPKNIVHTNRVFPKVDKVLEFEKALAAHAQKYHNGDWKWRVYEIASGPDAGGYHITEGPNTWTTIDGRGEISTEHNQDWNKTVAIYLTDRSSEGYAAYQDSLSTVALGQYSDKIQITHMFSKIGWVNKLRDLITLMKGAWLAGDEHVAVYASAGSGPTQYTLVTRYKNGFQDRAAPGMVSFKDRMEKANGSDAWDKYLDILRNYLNDVWSELLTYRADLSSK